MIKIQRWLSAQWGMGLIILSLLILLAGCGGSTDAAGYQIITPEAAYEQLADDETIVLLDVRTESEYQEKHIPGSVLLPLDTLAEQAAEILPDQEATIFVYCRSGNRSKTAANQLLEAGYTNVYDLGGINNWPYETE